MRTPIQNKDEGVRVDRFTDVENARPEASMDLTSERKIQEILSKLDELETQVRAIYNNWFVKPSRLGVVK